jgi:hypothetical protein
MRYFPIKILILCILFPPLVYVFSIQLLEGVIQKRYDRELEAVYAGDTRLLFEGSVRLQDAIRDNVDAFIASRKLVRWGVRLDISIKTEDGVYLYPSAFSGSQEEIGLPNSIEVARENFRLLDEGLVRIVDVNIEHNTVIANLILVFCLTTSILVLTFYYRRGAQLIRQEEQARQQVIDRLAVEREQSLNQLEQLESQRRQLSSRIDSMRSELKQEREKTTAAEDEMMDELIALEEQISEQQAQRERQLTEINELKEKLKLLEKKDEAAARQQLKSIDAAGKRFKTLYKNLAINDRAVQGFIELTDEMKIKAEEVIHQLNDDPKQVQIKRKVFGKKNRETVFEVIFAYKGRLYFRTLAGNRVEVLVIGTKLSQNKDLAFLDKL